MNSWQGWARALPDSVATVNQTHVSGNTVIFELTWTGTHTGPMMSPKGEIPATHKSVEVRGCYLSEVENGKVTYVRHYFDMATLLGQLGLMG